MTKRNKRHTPDQIVAKLKDAGALLNVGQSLAQTLQITESTYHRWRGMYGGMKAEEAKRLKDLEKENARLKKLVADAKLDKAMLKELLEGKW